MTAILLVSMTYIQVFENHKIFKNKIYVSFSYLFIHLTALGLSCGTQALCCGTWDFLLCLAFSLAVGCGLQSMWGSIVAAVGLVLHSMWDPSSPARD